MLIRVKFCVHPMILVYTLKKKEFDSVIGYSMMEQNEKDGEK